MENKRIYIDENDKRVYIDTYVIKDGRVAPRDAILVIPGGGYGQVCSDREGEFIALAYAARGVNAFVLEYNVEADSVFPSQLLDAARAVKWIKEHAEEFHINPERIFAVGFSAGAHLAGILTVHHSIAEEKLGLPADYLKVRGVVLSYPVVTAYGPTHLGSFKNLSKKPFEELTDDEKRLYSLEFNVKPDTPPAFIWHTSTDTSVPVNGSLKLAMAYHDAKIPVELHVYPNGPHGLALGTEYTSGGMQTHVVPDVCGWLDASVHWMKNTAV